jgi:quercetin dioxygenase-like cupin family protein
MKQLKPSWIAILVFACSVLVFAQDPVKIDPTHYKVLLENAAVRVLHVTYPAGAKSPMHQHPDAIAVALTPAKVHFAFPDGKSQDADMANESALYTPAGPHSPTNLGTAAMEAIVVEFKAAAPGKATLPTTRENATMKLLAEGPRASAYRGTMSPAFAEAPGTKHDFDQVVIALGPSQMSLSINGQPAKTTWKRGDVQFIGRNVPHEGKNMGKTASDIVIIMIK